MATHFQSPHLFWWITICAGIIASLLLAHYPSVIPYSRLGVLGALLSSLVSHYRLLLILAFWSTVIAHAYEAILACRICQQLHIDPQSTLLWCMQTFLLGYPSLILLKRYAQQRR